HDEQQQRRRQEADRRTPVRREIGVAEAHGDEVRSADEDDPEEGRERGVLHARARLGARGHLSQTRSPKKKSCPWATVRVVCVVTSRTKKPPVPTYAIFDPSGDQAGTTSSPVCPTDFTDEPSHGMRKSSEGMLRCASCGPATGPRGIAYGAPEPASLTVCPAAERMSWQLFGENRGACRYQTAAFVFRNGAALLPSVPARRRPALCASFGAPA